MKKGDFISVSKNAKYSGQEMSWLEPMTDSKVLKKGTKLLHASDQKITAFYPKETCFFTDNRSVGHIYVITLQKDVLVEFYGEEEVRFQLEPNNAIIQYIGYRGQDKKWNYVYRDFTEKKYLSDL